MMVRDEAQFIESVIRQVVPYVNRILIAVDKRSVDNTEQICERLAAEFPNIFVELFDVSDHWAYDLPDVLNGLLKKTTEKWIWVLDGDEFYPTEDINRLVTQLSKDVPGEDAYAFQFWYLIDRHHVFSGKQYAGLLERVFRNSPTLHWVGQFPGTHIFDGPTHMWFRRTLRVKKLPEVNYVHFSLLKKRSWRKDAGLVRPVDPKDPRKIRVPRWVDEVVDKVLGPETK